MQVFKTYFRLLNAYKGIIIMYFVIFIAVALVMTSNSSLATNSEMSSEVTKLDIAIMQNNSNPIHPKSNKQIRGINKKDRTRIILFFIYKRSKRNLRLL